MAKCVKRGTAYAYDHTWTSDVTSESEKKKGKNSIKYRHVRDFEHKRNNRRLKLGETLEWGVGYTFDNWKAYGVS